MDTRRRGHSKSHSVLTAVASLGMMIIVTAVVFPAFVPCGHNACQASHCQSNLKQIGNAVKMYLSDWNDTYPTNRPYLSGKRIGPVRPYVRLSKAMDTHGVSRKQTRRPNWVEGLSPYVETITKSSEVLRVWQCDSIWKPSFFHRSRPAGVTYVFSGSLVEKPEGVVRTPATLMMARQMDRLTHGAALRPANDCTWTSNRKPISPFLTTRDARLGRTQAKLHSNGSHVLFADGHVKIFDTSFFPSDAQITASRCWDPRARQWLNYAPGSGARPAYIGSIAITP